ncbi:testis-expressed protein 2 isoform X1 [Amblyomma americanum]
MTHRLSLSKLTGKQAPTPAMPVMSFRYNPCDEDIQELQPVGSKDDGATQQQQPPQVASSSAPGTSAQTLVRPAASSGSRESSVERRGSLGPSVERRATSAPDLDVLDHPLATIERRPTPEPLAGSTSGMMADPLRTHVTDSAPAAEFESSKAESSPVKDSVKDYLSKFSKKASISGSADTSSFLSQGAAAGGSAPVPGASTSDGTDSWFTGLKGRITKRLEEKRHGTRLLRRDDDSKSMSASAAASDAAGSSGGAVGSGPHDDETVSVRTAAQQLDECKEVTEKLDDTSTVRTGSARLTAPLVTTDEGMDPDLATWEFVEQPERPLKQAAPCQLPAASRDLATAFQGAPTLNFTAIAHAMMNKNSFLISGLVGLMAVVMPMPSFSSGFIFGCVLAFFVFSFLWYLLVPTQERFPFEVPDYQRMPPLRVPRLPAGDSSRADANSFEGWMSQLPFETEYRIETHHMNNTQSVHLVLTGSTLRLRWPKNPVPRRAMWNEKRPEPVFISQRHFNLIDAKVMLLPEKLARDRLWNKKYPICLLIPSEDHHMRQAQGGSNQADATPRFNADEEGNDVVKDLFVRSCNPDETATAAPTTATSAKEDSAPPGSAVAGKDSSQEKPSPVETNATVSKDAGQLAVVPPAQASSEHEVLYLFARTCREKEEWFRRFQQAIAQGSKTKRTRFDDMASQPISFETYIEELQLRHREQQWLSPFLSAAPPVKGTNIGSILASPAGGAFTQSIKSDTQWLNMLVGRLFYDVFTQPEWADIVRRRIQKKLSRIKVPFFMEELTVTDIHLGSQLPYVRRTSEAVVDKRGVWVDMDVTYNGAFYMTLSTKLNLMRLKRSQTEEMQSFAINHDAYDDESAASSSDEEGAAADKGESSAISRDPSSATGTGKKLLELVDKIAQSRYFQQATENRYIKRKMEEVSNTPLVLTVEVSHLVGTLALNIPPPPTDRIWYGFRTLPKMQLVARPKLGAKEVTIARVTERIEKMLFLEFQRVFVMPNMDDFLVPFMYSDVTES